MPQLPCLTEAWPVCAVRPVPGKWLGLHTSLPCLHPHKHSWFVVALTTLRRSYQASTPMWREAPQSLSSFLQRAAMPRTNCVTSCMVHRVTDPFVVSFMCTCLRRGPQSPEQPVRHTGHRQAHILPVQGPLHFVLGQGQGRRRHASLHGWSGGAP